MKNFEKCSIAMLGGSCSQHVTGNTSRENQPKSAIMQPTSIYSLVHGASSMANSLLPSWWNPASTITDGPTLPSVPCTQTSKCLSPCRLRTRARPSMWCNLTRQWRHSVSSAGCPKHDDVLPTGGGADDALNSVFGIVRGCKNDIQQQEDPRQWYPLTSSVTN